MKIIITRVEIVVIHDDKYTDMEKEVREPARKILFSAVKKPQEWELAREITHSGMTHMSFLRSESKS